MRDIKQRIKELKMSAARIDFNNTEQLAKDVWLFLTTDKMPAKATIKREALYHEVSAMIDSAARVRAREHAIAFAKWCLKEGWADFDGVDQWINIGKSKKSFSTNELYQYFIECEYSPPLNPISQ